MASSFASDILVSFGPVLDHYDTLISNATYSRFSASEEQPDDGTLTPISASLDSNSAIVRTVQEIAEITSVNSSGSLPNPTVLINTLNKLDEAFIDDNQSKPGQTQHLESLRIMALARLTFTSYALVLESLLKDASRLEDESWYWTEIEESTSKAVSYLIQTLPLRITALLRKTLEIAAENAAKTVRNTFEMASSKSDHSPMSINAVAFKRALTSLLNTPGLITAAMFPYALQLEHSVGFCNQPPLPNVPVRPSNDSTSASVLEAQVIQPRGLLPSGQNDRKPTKSLRSAVLKVSPTHFIRHEARCKRRGLLHQRDVLAEKIGQLALKHNEMCGNETASIQTDREASTVQDMVLNQLGLNLKLMATSLGMESVSSDNEFRIEMDLSPSSEVLASSLRNLLTESMSMSSWTSKRILSPDYFGQPSKLVQNWPTLVFYPAGLFILSRFLSKNWNGIASKMQEAKDTVRGFLIGWIWEPCVHLLDTIRSGNQGGMIVSRESLNSDLESLQRMVSSFAQDQYGITGAELDVISLKVKEGDLTHVLKVYEHEIKSPFKSTFSGSLIRSLLIQIQKAKVDLEVAMSGIDQLLKSQQLLFGGVGIAPALGVLYVGTSWIRSKLSGFSGNRARKVGQNAQIRSWEAMRRIDRLLSAPPNMEANNKSEKGKGNDLSPLTHGLLLLDLSLLRSMSEPLMLAASKGRKARAKRLEKQFLQDVRELEASGTSRRDVLSAGDVTKLEPGIGYWSRRAAIERMWRSWGHIFAQV